MSTKRTSDESSSDEQTIECSDSVFQQEDSAKHGKLASLCDRTLQLQDIPIAQLEYILLRVIIMEVKDANLTKRASYEKAGLVINRLRAVCLQWSSVLTTFSFLDKPHRTLDDITYAQEMIRLEILHQSPIESYIFRVATTKDEIFALCRPENQDPFINVCDLNHMEVLKDFIPLPGILPEDIAGCSVSNCVYLLNKESHYFSVLRITRNGEHQFIITPWLNDLGLSFIAMRLFVAVNGNLIILSKQIAPIPSEVSVYSVDGSIQSALALFPAIHGFRLIFSVIQKPNGNFVLATVNDVFETVVKEIDPIGRIVRQFHSSLFGDSGVIDADAHGGIMVAGVGNKAELLDSELNRLEFTVTSENEKIVQIPHGMHYNSERNEIVRLFEIASGIRNRAITIYRFTRE